MQMANKHIERCLTLLIIREIRIKTTMRYHIPLRMASPKNLQTMNAGQDVEKREPSCAVGGDVS